MGKRQFGKLYTDAADALLTADGMTLNAMRLFVWSLRFSTDASKLDGCDADTLEGWLVGRGLPVSLSSLQVTHFSLGQAAEVMGSKTEAGRQVKRLCDCGVLSKAGVPSKGHAQLYVINPNGYTSERVPNHEYMGVHPDVYQSATNRYTSEGEWVHIGGQIGTHRNAVTCGDISPSEVLQSNTSEKKEAQKKKDESITPPQCPKCGNRMRPTLANRFFCSPCDFELHVSETVSPSVQEAPHCAGETASHIDGEVA